MEKICIAKRRRANIFPQADGLGEDRSDEPSHTMLVPVRPAESFSQGSANVISMELTPAQSRLIQSHARLSAGRTYVVDLETEKANEGLVIFNFRIAPFHGGRMLSPRDVCGMLKISRSSLTRLVRSHEVDSYKIGRLRRFLLEDVLHYLGRNEGWMQGRECAPAFRRRTHQLTKE